MEIDKYRRRLNQAVNTAFPKTLWRLIRKVGCNLIFCPFVPRRIFDHELEIFLLRQFVAKEITVGDDRRIGF